MRRSSKWISLWLGATLVAVPLDDFVYRVGWHTSQGFLHDIVTAVDYMGGYPIHLLVSAILASSPNRRGLFLGYGVTMIGQGLVTDLIKITVGRARPMLEMGSLHFRPFSSFDGTNSFPSGDAVAAMTLATLLGFYFPRSRNLFWLLGIAAGIARVAREQHYLSDVVFGCGLGCAIAFLFYGLLGPERFDFRLDQRGPSDRHQPGFNGEYRELIDGTKVEK